MPASKFDRVVTNHRRAGGGDLRQDERKPPTPPKFYSGGGGLYCTAADYVRFMQMILNKGIGANKTRILQAKTVESMMVNQIGAATAGKMKSYRPDLSSDVDIQPGHPGKSGPGLPHQHDALPRRPLRRKPGLGGTLEYLFWIDPKRNLCAVLLMQFLPFVDPQAVGLLGDFERAVYQARLS